MPTPLMHYFSIIRNDKLRIEVVDDRIEFVRSTGLVFVVVKVSLRLEDLFVIAER